MTILHFHSMALSIISYIIIIIVGQISTVYVPQPITGKSNRIINILIALATYVYDLWGSSSQFNDVQNMMNMWSVSGFVSSSNRVQYCESDILYYLGGPGLMQSTGSMQRSYYGFAAHNIIYFGFRIGFSGTWTATDMFSVQFNNGELFRFVPGGTITSDISATCSGNSGYITFVAGKVFHTDSYVDLDISWNFSGNDASQAIFLKDLYLSFANAQTGDVEEAHITLKNSSINNSTQCSRNNYYDTSTNSCASCTSTCLNCFGPGSNQCYSLFWNEFFDGTTAYPNGNTANCNVAYGLGTSQCLWCADHYNLNLNGSCTSSCDSPYISYGDYNFHACLYPCATTQYMQACLKMKRDFPVFLSRI